MSDAEEGGIACVTAMTALADPESMINWNSEESSVADALDWSTWNYDYMYDIDEFTSDEEEGEICDESTLSPPSPLVPEILHASYGKLDHSLTKDSSAMTHLEAQELRHSLISLESESLIESELKMLDTWPLLRISLAQSYPLSLMRAPILSLEPNLRLQAITEPQCFSVRSARTKNLEIIHASLRRSSVKFDNGVEQCALDVDYVHAGAADLSIIQAPLRDLHETSIQSVPKPDHVESMQQVPDLALIHAESEESWIIMSALALDMSFERNNSSLLTGVDSGPLAKNSISYSILSDKTVVFIQSSPLSQREHVNYVLGIPLSTSIWGNGVQRACPLFIYLVIWAPRDYIARAARYFYGGW